MGQAKQRGTREQRIAEALSLREIVVTDIKKELGISDDADFLGYAIHLEESDEFLMGSDSENLDFTRRAWAKTPELAATFGSFIEAYDVSKKCRGSIIVGIFDMDKEIIVAPVL